ncbi:hypothetical protein [Sulfitobacter sp. JB4-11]|uniref:hypothetical protein n=1 Tax=Sulfitobacter rhodophyticola TaxID=3238304 RepID=UPI0035186501
MRHVDETGWEALIAGSAGGETTADLNWAARFPASVQQAIAMGLGAWPLAVQRAIDAGIRDADRLADLAFWIHVPDLGGRSIPMNHGRTKQWVALWKSLRKSVTSILRAAPPAGGPGGGKATASTPFVNIRRVWVHTNTRTIVGSSSRAKRRRRQLCDLAPTDVMIGTNDVSVAHAARRNNTAFGTYSSARLTPALRDAIDELKSCGVAIHFMTWITARERYCRGLVDTMFELCTQTGARSLMLDAEEPWTYSVKGRSQAKSFVETVFRPLIAGRPCCVGVSHIVASSIANKLDPLIAACDYILPQAYSSARPGRLQGLAHTRWSSRGKTMVMGLSGMSRVSKSGMLADLKATDGLGDVQEVYYWSFGHLRGSSSRFNVVKAAAQRARATRAHLPPPPLCHIPWPLF